MLISTYFYQNLWTLFWTPGDHDLEKLIFIYNRRIKFLYHILFGFSEDLYATTSFIHSLQIINLFKRNLSFHCNKFESQSMCMAKRFLKKRYKCETLMTTTKTTMTSTIQRINFHHKSSPQHSANCFTDFVFVKIIMWLLYILGKRNITFYFSFFLMTWVVLFNDERCQTQSLN